MIPEKACPAFYTQARGNQETLQLAVGSAAEWRYNPAISREVKMRALTLTLGLLLSGVLPAVAQHSHSNYPTPPEPAERATQSAPAKVTRTRLPADPVQLQREAREMLDLSQSVVYDMDSVSHGLLPKDLNDKLKRIEKLSKHLRNEVGPH
jgi:hypothetical protein